MLNLMTSWPGQAGSRQVKPGHDGCLCIVEKNRRAAKGDLDGALQDFTEAIRLRPDSAEAYLIRGAARGSKDDRASIKAAIADFQKYLDLGGGIRDGDQAEVEQYIRDLKNKL